MRGASNRPKPRRGILAGLMSSVLLFPLSAWAANYWVDDTSDPGVASANDCSTTCELSVNCSLMDALAKATSTDDIRFCAAGTYNLTTAGTYDLAATINVTVDNITINGGATYGQDHNAIIKGPGSTKDCISTTTNSNLTVKGLTIQNCRAAVYLGGTSTSGHRIQNNYLGTDATGTSSGAGFGNSWGVQIVGSDNNFVGTDGDSTNDASEGNLIIPAASGSKGVGVQNSGTTGNRVAGNVIGLTSAGAASGITNSWGISIESGTASTTVGTNGDGTSDSAERNVISGFSSSGYAGISISGSNSNVIAGNYIGTGTGGTTAIGNNIGILIAGTTTSNTIGTNGDGTADAAERNVIAANTANGIQTSGSVSGTVIAGNYIGVGSDGSTDLGNGTHGIILNNQAASNTIGGDIAAEANLIRFNGDAASEFGILITGASATGNSILRNSIYDNQAGETSIANNATTTPTVSTTAAGASAGQIQATITSTAGYSVQLYSDTDGDGGCEAQTFLGNATDVGDGTFTYTTSNLTIGTKIVAAAKDATNNTSAFSSCLSTTDLPPVLNPIGGKSVGEGSSLSFTATSYEPNTEDASPTYSCTNDNAAAVSGNVCQYFNTATGAFLWTAGYSQSGSYTVTFKSTDASDGTLFDTEQVTITVDNSDTTPSLEDPGSKSVGEMSALAFTLVGSDADGDTPLTYSCSANCPSGLSVNSSTGAVSWTPSYSQAASYSNVTFRVADAQANATTRAITVTVSNTDTTPTLTDPGSQSASEGNTLTFTLTGTDADGDSPLSYSCSANCPSGLSVNSSTGSVAWTPNYEQAGTYSDVTFRVSDAGGNSSTGAIAITVASTPTISVADAEGSSSDGAITVTVTMEGTSNSAVTVAYATSDGTAAAGTDYTAASGTLTWQAGETGAKSFTVPVTTGLSYDGTRTFQITLSGATNAAISDDSATVTLTGALDDDDEVGITDRTIEMDEETTLDCGAEYVTCRWKVRSGDGRIDTTEGRMVTFTAPVGGGNTQIELTVINADGQTVSSRTITIYAVEPLKLLEETCSGNFVGLAKASEVEDVGGILLVEVTAIALPSEGAEYTFSAMDDGRLIIGLPDEGDGRGAVYLSAVPASDLPGRLMTLGSEESSGYFELATGNNAGDRFGELLATGDINGDGGEEIIVGAPGAGLNGNGIAYLYNSDFEQLGAIYGDDGHQIRSFATGSYISSAAADILFGPANNLLSGDLRRGASASAATAGAGFVLQGGAGMAGGVDISVTGTDASFDSSAYLSAAIGDLNGDGLDDIAFASENGTASIFFGGDATPQEADVAISGGPEGARFGQMTAIGDLTGDGIGDLAISAPGASDGKGTIYLVFGSAYWRGEISLATSSGVSILTGSGASDGLGSDLLIGGGDAGLEKMYTTKGSDAVCEVKVSVPTSSATSGDDGYYMGGNIGCMIEATSDARPRAAAPAAAALIALALAIATLGRKRARATSKAARLQISPDRIIASGYDENHARIP